jgi:hypothetical protein
LAGSDEAGFFLDFVAFLVAAGFAVVDVPAAPADPALAGALPEPPVVGALGWSIWASANEVAPTIRAAAIVSVFNVAIVIPPMSRLKSSHTRDNATGNPAFPVGPRQDIAQNPRFGSVLL